jgi:hypothetical protein
MNEEQETGNNAELVARGSRQYKMVMGVAIVTAAAVLAEELSAWHALGFVIAQSLLLCLVAFFAYYVGSTGRMRWGQFMAMLACGAHHFLLGGLHLTDPKEGAVDPLCYVLAMAGLLVVGLGCYVLYSIEIDAFFRKLRGGLK